MGVIDIRKFIAKWHKAQSRPYQPKPFMVPYLAMLIFGATAAVGAYFALNELVPGASKNSLEVAKTALTVVAGCGAVAALYVAYRKQRNEEANSNRERDRLFTDRFTMAAEQLGHEAAAVRLAGMYALARIADDSERDRETCMNVICAYLRMPYEALSSPVDRAEGNVRLAAQRLLEERLRPNHPHFWKNADVDLSGASLDSASFGRAVFQKAVFIRAQFHGNTIFGVAQFEWRTWFDEAVFHDRVWFGHSRFKEQVSFTDAKFHSSALFVSASFEHASVKFDRVLFGGKWTFRMHALSIPLDSRG
ncbi:pentapeptide repeat-containing protein [Streptomyces sp. NPDC094448]|uniref:pentapeptide repeat-containing protein n=1 Tax=Streptomyces sp. NPDC094448 TaxID=3366063 RepID=UPI003830C13C